jgi:mRNA-degrading endonuclease YafQ of YafQ-DinJ toxin-antitoxin module
MEIFYDPRFYRSLKKLPKAIAAKTIESALLFGKDPFNSRLGTHKLHGKLRHLWSFSVDSKYRVLLILEKSEAIFLDVGDHDIYK